MRVPRCRTLTRVALLAALGMLLAACADPDLPQDVLSPAGPIARQQDDLWRLVFPAAVGVFILVEGLILIAIWRFRSRGDEPELPKQVAGNTRLEIAWTIVPAAILVWIAVPTIQTLFALEEEPDEGERINVRVTGLQYWWDFEYVDDDVVTANELVIPTGTPVRLELNGIGEYELADGSPAQREDLVIHSFWVPRLAGKLDLIPGHRRYLTIAADEPGVYPGQCAEFCGLSHANMRFLVRAVEPAEYEDWLAAQAEPAEEAPGGQAARGQELFGANCAVCHTVRGHPANQGVRVGPDLTHFASRETFAAGIFETDDTEQLRAWIRNASGEKPGVQMIPFSDLADEEIDALAAYLQSLE